MIARLAARARREQRARDVDHARAQRTLIEKRGAAAGAEASRRSRRLVLETRDGLRALHHPHAAPPAADIGGVGAALRMAARGGVIVPRPERRQVDLDANRAAHTAPLGTRAISRFSFFGRCAHASERDGSRLKHFTTRICGGGADITLFPLFPFGGEGTVRGLRQARGDLKRSDNAVARVGRTQKLILAREMTESELAPPRPGTFIWYPAFACRASAPFMNVVT